MARETCPAMLMTTSSPAPVPARRGFCQWMGLRPQGRRTGTAADPRRRSIDREAERVHDEGAPLSPGFLRGEPRTKLLMDDARIIEMVHRDAEGFWALAASLDLIGMSAQMAHYPPEARARLNDLQQGFGEALCRY